MRLYDLRNYRSNGQLAAMDALERAGICIFCPENLTADPDHLVLHETANWVIIKNKFPYKGTRLHILLVPRTHVEDILDLDADAKGEYWPLLDWVKKKFGLDFFAVGMRTGDFHRTGSSIAHAHIHVIVGDVEAPGHEPVRFKMSSSPP
jgi:ATP adenylyltransferase